MPKIGGSPFFTEMLTKDLEKVTGSTIIISINPEEAALKLLEIISSKKSLVFKLPF